MLRTRSPRTTTRTGVAATIGLVAALASPAFAADLVVPDDFGTIQAAIDAAAPGDTVIVMPGTYVESIVVPPPAFLTLTGSDPSDPAVVAATVLVNDGEFDRTVTWLPTQGSRMTGLTITGNGMQIGDVGAPPVDTTIDRCRFVDNTWWAGSGGAMFCRGSVVNIINCLFENNSSPSGKGTTAGSAIWSLFGGDLRVTGCAFIDNDVDASGVGGGAIGVSGTGSTPVSIVNATFRGNTSTNGTGAVYVDGVDLEIENSIFWDNGNDPIVFLSSSLTAANTIAEGGLPAGFTDGGGNTTDDPLFVAADDARLQEGSPAVDAGNEDLLPFDFLDLDGDGEIVERVPVDLDGDVRTLCSNVDLGAYEVFFPQTVENVTQGTTFCSVAGAIEAALDGDVLVLQEGTHPAIGLNPGGKNLVIRSTDPSDPAVVAATILQGDNDARVITYNSGEDATSVLDGLTITGGNAGQGGGIRCGASSPTIRRCVIRFNQSDSAGGGLSFASGSQAIVESCDIHDNTSLGSGGGIDIRDEGTFVRIVDSRIRRNLAADNAGGIRVRSNAVLEIVNCEINGNDAFFETAGALQVSANARMHMANCSIGGNEADGFRGIRVLSADSTVTNCAFIGHGGEHISPDTVATVTYCVLPDGWPGEGNVDANPNFVDGNGPDGFWGTADDNMRLSPGSPAIDAGDNAAPGLGGVTTDIAGRARFQDDPGAPDATGCSNIDVGAHEFETGIDSCCEGDFDGSGAVDFNDLVSLLAAWGDCPDGGPCPADFDGSGTVDFSDLVSLLAAWGPCV